MIVFTHKFNGKARAMRLHEIKKTKSKKMKRKKNIYFKIYGSCGENKPSACARKNYKSNCKLMIQLK